MNKICTTIEQSKKLMELGIDVSTADMFYAYRADIQTGEWGLSKTPVIIDGSEKIDPVLDVPAWSLTALINLIPKNIRDHSRVFRMDVGEVDTSMWYDELETVKPYLRSMSSITEEEKEKIKNISDAEEVTSDSICYLEGDTLEDYMSEIPFILCYNIIAWLLENHFDFMGLIPKGLAVEVTPENNPYKYV